MESRPVIVALDFEDANVALELVDKLSPEDCRLKIGKQMFTLYGSDFVKSIVNRGFDVFLDLKFHDIPNTVEKAIEAAAKLGIWMINVHASGGADMIAAAKRACLSADKPLLLTAVTVLTSMDQPQFEDVYGNTSIEEKVKSLSLLAKQAGADGVVCSAHEAQPLRKIHSDNFKLVTPGIRPSNSEKDDQSRIMTPEQAVASGVDYMVIGRPITKAADPFAALSEINRSVKDLQYR